MKSTHPNKWRAISKQYEKIQLWEHVGFSCSPIHNKAVVEFIQEWQSQHKNVVVVSGSAAQLAHWASEGLEDVESFGSTLDTNLTKSTKANFLATRYSQYRITYIGDSPDDLHVWKICDDAVLIENRKLKETEIKSIENIVRKISSVSWWERTLIWLRLFSTANPSRG